MNRLRIAVVALSLAGAGALAVGTAAGEESPRLVPAPAAAFPADGPPGGATRALTVAGGCFWGVQGVFEHVRGVTRATAGYAGGRDPHATYEEVSTGTTGHAESVRIEYDPRVVSEGRLLQIFFSVALDPTERNRQGPDEGTQYRSAIFTSDPAEAAYARSYIAELDAAHAYGAPIATRVETAPVFVPAESYHQDYLVRNPGSAYIEMNDLPKVAALKRLFPTDATDKPVLVASGA